MYRTNGQTSKTSNTYAVRDFLFSFRCLCDMNIGTASVRLNQHYKKAVPYWVDDTIRLQTVVCGEQCLFKNFMSTCNASLLYYMYVL